MTYANTVRAVFIDALSVDFMTRIAVVGCMAIRTRGANKLSGSRSGKTMAKRFVEMNIGEDKVSFRADEFECIKQMINWAQELMDCQFEGHEPNKELLKIGLFELSFALAALRRVFFSKEEMADFIEQRKEELEELKDAT